MMIIRAIIRFQVVEVDRYLGILSKVPRPTIKSPARTRAEEISGEGGHDTIDAMGGDDEIEGGLTVMT